ncbi:amidohydrolase [Polymorphobacter multimanifer]|uniref:carbon-nitrogen hydrolase family protein n=1 Tax=Polymorphobacter multimanifer TaxID=1070431 RepID=UPI0016633E01|nr:carbon-nitrogen hydrolase family protein [Polymorphobacter multimanifer]GGI94066.1 amidohydrolase [Polymorphobacter multimanifer]
MRIGLLQTTTGIGPAAEAVALAGQVGAAAALGVEMLFTPEMSGLLDRDRARAASQVRAEADDPVLAAVREAAGRHGIWVQLGSLALQGAGEKFVNRGFLIGPEGEVAARYAKIHLFDVSLGSESWRESAAYQAGEEAVVAATPWGALGMTICSDLRFPALHRALAEAGAAMLAVPAAFTRPTGEAHWHVLLRARAIETGSFVIAAAQSGTHADGRATYGHSLVVSPWGEVLLDMGEAPGLGVLDIDLADVATARSKIPALQHARPFRPPTGSDG